MLTGGSMTITQASIAGVAGSPLPTSALAVNGSSLFLDRVLFSALNVSTPSSRNLFEGCVRVFGAGPVLNVTNTSFDGCISDKTGASLSIGFATSPGASITLSNVDVRNARSPNSAGIVIGRNQAPVNVTTSGRMTFVNNSAIVSASGFHVNANAYPVTILGPNTTWTFSQQSAVFGAALFLTTAALYPKSNVFFEALALVVNEAAQASNSLMRSGSALYIDALDALVQATIGSITVTGNQFSQPFGPTSAIKFEYSRLTQDSPAPTQPSFLRVLNDLVVVNTSATAIEIATSSNLADSDVILIDVLGDIILRDNHAEFNMIGNVSSGGIISNVAGARTIFNARNLEITGCSSHSGGAIHVYNSVAATGPRLMQVNAANTIRLAHNSAIGAGGAVFVDLSAAAFIMSAPSIIMTENRAAFGGAMASKSSSAIEVGNTTTSVTFVNNTASSAGGVFYGFGYPNTTIGLDNFTLPGFFQQFTTLFVGNNANQGCVAAFNAPVDLPLCNLTQQALPLAAFSSNYYLNASQVPSCGVVDSFCNVSPNKTKNCPPPPQGAGLPTLWTSTDACAWIYSGDLNVIDLIIESTVVVTGNLAVSGSITWISKNGSVAALTVGSCVSSIPMGYIQVTNQSEVDSLKTASPAVILRSQGCRTNLESLRLSPSTYANSYAVNWSYQSAPSNSAIVIISGVRPIGSSMLNWILLGVICGLALLAAVGLLIWLVRRRLMKEDDPQKQPLIVNRDETPK